MTTFLMRAKSCAVGAARALSRASVVAALAAIAIICYPIYAIAQEAAPTALDTFSQEVLNIVIPVALTLVTGLIAVYLKKLAKKVGVELSDTQIQSWSSLAKKGVLRAGEWARKEVHERAEGKKIPGPQVMEVAANWALNMGKKMKLPDIGREQLEALIEAELFGLRLENPPPGVDPYAAPEPGAKPPARV